jgi:hypothetical protein
MSEQVPGKTAHSGGCLCGAVRYEVRGPLRDALVCHCSMCQRTHGAPAPYTAAGNDDLRLLEGRGLKWYRSSESAERGFCGGCGASLFWRPTKGTYTAIACGTLDQPSGVRAVGHIFLVDRGDYYTLADGLPQFERGTGGRVPAAPSVV